MEQINIPEQLNPILRDYVLQVLKEKPQSLIEWSAKYFDNQTSNYAKLFLAKLKILNLSLNDPIDLPKVLDMFKNSDLQQYICKGNQSTCSDYLQVILNFQFYPKTVSIAEFMENK